MYTLASYVSMFIISFPIRISRYIGIPSAWKEDHTEYRWCLIQRSGERVYSSIHFVYSQGRQRPFSSAQATSVTSLTAWTSFRGLIFPPRRLDLDVRHPEVQEFM